jgi:serine/threonine-protein kinase
VLGALAIISAILIVLADRERRSNTPVEQTVTDTVSPEPATPARPSGWSDRVLPDGGTDIAALPAVIRMAAPETATVFAPDDETPR